MKTAKEYFEQKEKEGKVMPREQMKKEFGLSDADLDAAESVAYESIDDDEDDPCGTCDGQGDCSVCVDGSEWMEAEWIDEEEEDDPEKAYVREQCKKVGMKKCIMQPIVTESGIKIFRSYDFEKDEINYKRKKRLSK